MLGILFSALLIIAMIFTLVTIISSDQSQIRYLDKIFWVIIVILIPLIGMVVFWLVGKEYGDRTESVSFGDPRRTAEANQPQEMTDEEIEAAVQEEIEYHEREAHIRRLEAELREKRDQA